MVVHWIKCLVPIVLLLCFLPGNSAISCYTCDDQLGNDNCNVAETTCDGSCYTTIKRLEATGKRYFKGCMDTETCDRYVGLRDDKYCPFFPSECTYCCNDKDLCNAENGAPEVTSSHRRVVISMLGILMVMLL